MRFGAGAAASGFAMRLASVQAVNLALVFVVFTQAGPALAGLVLALRSVPSILLPWFAGWFYDRHSPRILVFVTAVLESLLVGAAFMTNLDDTAKAGLLALGLGCTAAVYDTSVTATVKDTGASVLKATVFTGLAYDVAKVAAALLAFMVTPAHLLAGLLCVVLTVAGGLVLTYSASTAPVPALGEKGRLWGAWLLPAVPALVAVCILDFTVGSLFFWQGLLAHGDAVVFLVINAAMASGAVAGNLVLARAGLSKPSVRVGVLLSALGLFGASWLTGPVLIGVCCFTWGLGVAWWFQGFRAWIVSSAPDGFRGRAGTALVVSARLSLTLSSIVLGLMLAVWGLGFSSVLTLLASLLIVVFMPAKTLWKDNQV